MDDKNTEYSIGLTPKSALEIAPTTKRSSNKLKLVLVTVGVLTVIFTILSIFVLGKERKRDPSTASQLPLNSLCNSVDNNSLFTSKNPTSMSPELAVKDSEVNKYDTATPIFLRLVSKQPFIVEPLNVYFDENGETTSYLSNAINVYLHYLVDETDVNFVNKLSINSIFETKIGDNTPTFMPDSTDGSYYEPSSAEVLYDIKSATLSDVVQRIPQFKNEKNISALLMSYSDYSLGFRRKVKISQNGLVFYYATDADNATSTYLNDNELKKLENILKKNDLFSRLIN